jgi:hypothetical protein
MIPPALGALAAVLHAIAIARYGYFRDELYFIACSKHLAWGYVDQPPLVPLAAWAAAPIGYALPALRALPLAAAAALVYLAAQWARELGGGRFAQALAGIATLLAPAYLLLGNTLTTTSFEPLLWTLAFYIAFRLVRAPAAARSRWTLALGCTIAAASYAKYSVLLPVAGLAAGLLATQRDRLRWHDALGAILLPVVLLSPNLYWQAQHGWPILDVLRGDLAHRHPFAGGLALESLDVLRNALYFTVEQFLYVNPLAAPVWIAGLVAPFRLSVLRDLRFIPVACAVVIAVALALAAKGYYVVGLYASLFAIGAVAIERAATAARVTIFAALTAAGVAALPLSLPILPVGSLVAYGKFVGISGRNGEPAHLIQPVFAEEFGWQRLARDVAAVYFSLPANVRQRAAVYADTYGDAGALDFFGPRYGLPPAISSQNSYYLWGTRGYDGSVLVAIGASRIDLLRRFYRSVVLVRTSDEPYKWIVEGPAPIYLCTQPVAPLPVVWPQLRWYGA